VLFDDKLDTGISSASPWHFSWTVEVTGTLNAYVSLKLPSLTIIGAYTMVNNNRSALSASWAPVSWVLEASNDDGATWTTLNTENYKLSQGESKLFYTKSSESFNVFRWTFSQDDTATFNDETYISIAELKLHEGIPTARNVHYLTNDPALNELTGYATLNQSTKDSIGTGWTQIKYLPGTSTTWFPENDHLLGYGGKEFLFTRGDFSAWLITRQEEVNGEYYTSTARWITKSSISNTPYQAIWYNRSIEPVEPTVGLKDHNTSVTDQTILYTEYGAKYYNNSIHPSGMYVFVR
jgi:hypothetical protein